MDFVAGGYEVFEGGDDREAGADRGFVVDEAAVGGLGGCCGCYGGPEGEAAAEGFFVGGYDADACLEEKGVAVRDVLVTGVVYQNAFSGGFGGAVAEVVENFFGG